MRGCQGGSMKRRHPEKTHINKEGRALCGTPARNSFSDIESDITCANCKKIAHRRMLEARYQSKAKLFI